MYVSDTVIKVRDIFKVLVRKCNKKRKNNKYLQTK